MFKYVYEVAPIDFADGTISIENYIDSIISELSWYKKDLLDNVYDDEGANLCINPFDNTHADNEHVFNKLKKVGKDIENICEYFNKKKMKINRKGINIFSVPTDVYCTVSYMIQTDNNGITYIFSDLYFPFLDRKDNNIEKFN